MRIPDMVSAQEFLEQAQKKGVGPQMVGRSNAVRTTTEHGKFDSKIEAVQVGNLHVLQERGLICNLEKQKPYDLVVNGVIIVRYRADAVFLVRQEITLNTLDGPRVFQPGETVCLDVKGHKTEIYRIKSRLMKAVHGIDIIEV